MRANTASVNTAISRYPLQVLRAFFVIMILGFVLGFQELEWKDILTFRIFVEDKSYRVAIAARTDEMVNGKEEIYSATKEIHCLDAPPDPH